MKRACLASVAALTLLPLPATPLPAPRFDVVIRGGRVLDGAGNPWVNADVAIKDGRIAQVGDIAASGVREIDARGRYVAPGFIDMMDQSSQALLANSGAENKLLQGITTVITGEGGTPVPAAEIPAFFAQLERLGLPVNFGTYYATTQARAKVMGDSAGAPNGAQIAAMGAEVDTAMKAGVFGITSALIYAPSSFQSTADLVALAKVASQCGGIYATHLRNEAADFVPALREAIEIGEKGGVGVEIFHLKSAFRPGWGTLMPQALAAIEAARARGVDIAADMYVYAASGTGVEVTVPAWVWAQGREKGYALLRDPAVRARLKKEVAAGAQIGWPNHVASSGGWDNIILAYGQSDAYRRYEGMSFARIGAALGRDPADAAWDILLAAAPRRATALYFMMGEQDIELALRRPWVSIGSDAGAAVKVGAVDVIGLPHPRAFGNFARVIAEYVQKRHVLTLEDAVRKMTGWPATRMGLTDRGLIRPGMRADLIVFDPDKVRDAATYAQPLQPAAGVDEVLVNGVLAIDQGKPTGARAGQVMRHACSKPSSRAL